MLDHPWLSMPANYDTRMSEEDLQKYLERQSLLREIIEDPMQGEEMSKLEEADTELNAADSEDNNRSFFSDLEDDDENPYFGTDDSPSPMKNAEENTNGGNPKEYRDIAEGKNLNNSFTGPYPENWDHLHIDKGPNPQFVYLNEQGENNIFELAEKILNKQK